MQRFADRLTRAPIPHDPEAGAEAAAAFAGLEPSLRALLVGAAGGSPFLRGLMRREGDWLRGALDAAPETAFDALLAALPEAAPPAETARALRAAKGRAALLVALADLGGVWDVAAVTGALTRLADTAVQAALRALVAEAIARGRLPGAVPDDAATAAGMVVLAMGKMGAWELNYSSDIDLICLYDQTRYPGAEAEARAAFVRVTRGLAAMLSDMTEDGYVFRTDLRLRPDASVTPVCLSMAAAEAYYEAEGRTWERAAYIKARPCAGDLAAGGRFLRALVPFVWRRHLDFAAIEDAHAMRLRIREHRQLHGIAVEGHDLKLGAGGIREIEFFTQTRQLIAGGRDPSLRDPTTVGGLAALARAGWIPGGVAAALAGDYAALRTLEHRVQMVNDARTHAMPATPEGIVRIAHLCGEGDVAAFRAGLRERLERVHGLTEGFFAPAVPAAPPVALTEAQRRLVAGWAALPALRSDRAQGLWRRVGPAFLARLTAAANPDEALAAFDGFLGGLPAGVQVLSLFEANPALVDLFADILGTAPGLAAYLARNARVLDAVIGGGFWAPWPGVAALAAEAGAAMARVGDYEGRLDALRVWAREWHFRVGVHHLRGLIGAEEAGVQYAALAESVLAALFPVAVEAFARRHGPPPGRGAMVLGMGALGAGRMNAGSDLDLIVIYDPGTAEASDGPRPLPVRAYYARLTQALVTALSAPTAAGRLYAVDMRLRPSGRQGPVATSLAAFETYQRTEAWTWEHLALTRARGVVGEPGLLGAVEGVRRALIAGRGGGRPVAADTAAMRARLAAARPGGGVWEVKQGPGRLLDLDLFAQYCTLVAGSPARRSSAQWQAGLAAGVIGAEDAARLASAQRLMWQVQAGLRLLALPEGEAPGAGAAAFLLRETGDADIAALQARMVAETGTAAAVIAAHLPGGGTDEAG